MNVNTDERIISPAYIWFDTEFTGLNMADAQLLQVAMVITDVHLRRLTPPSGDICLCVKLAADVPLSDWVRKNLTGLLERCRSPEAVPVEEVDRMLSQRLDETLGPASSETKRRPVLAGNTIHMDAIMASRFLPEFSRRLHYRLFDVSTLKTFWTDSFAGSIFNKEDSSTLLRFLPEGFSLPDSAAHDAYYDIHATLAEMNYYRQNLCARQRS